MAQAIQSVETLPPPPESQLPLLTMIERLACDPNASMERFERLLAMQERLMASQARIAYVTACAAMQPELPVIGRRGRIEVRARDNQGNRTGNITQSTTFARWEDINESIKPILAKHGLFLRFRTNNADGRIEITGILEHVSGHHEETAIILPCDATGSKNNVQAVGSSISYGKRYVAGLLINFSTKDEDDDGVAAGSSGEPDLITASQIDTLEQTIKETGANKERFLAAIKCENLWNIRADKFDDAIALLKRVEQLKNKRPSQ